MTNMATGQCLCGAVKFQISGDFEHFFLCHCSRCRKDTGSAHSANLSSSTAKITWLSGEEGIRSFKLSGSQHAKSFCAECGSALPSIQMNGDLLVVPAGSLDTRIGKRPDAHICYASRAHWDEDLSDLGMIDGLPGQPISST